MFTSSGVPPAVHPYLVARKLYADMLTQGRNQSIIMMGEAGSGRSTLANHLLYFICTASKMQTNPQNATVNTGSMEDIFLQSIALMSSFGNAKTVQNNSSNRFGRWIELAVDVQGGIVGAHISHYLLEKKRVTGLTPGERNFNVFYQLIAGCGVDQELSEEFDLVDAYDFGILTNSDVMDIDEVDDLAEFNEMRVVARSLFPDKELSVYRIIAAILYIGNISFYEGGEGDVIVDVDSQDLLQQISEEFLGLPGSIDHLFTEQVSSISQSFFMRDHFVNSLYHMLFNWIIHRINESLGGPRGGVENLMCFPHDSPPSAMRSSSTGQCSSIGIADMFGFAALDRNGFYQCLHNYSAEKIQSSFYHVMFQSELNVYNSEGVTIQSNDINFPNNSHIIQLLEDERPPGILTMLDEQVGVGNPEDDNDFLEKINGLHHKHPSYKDTSKEEGPEYFGIFHFNRLVVYSVSGFVEKNKGGLTPEMVDALSESEDPFILEILGSTKANDPSSDIIPTTDGMATSTSLSFRSKLDPLIERMLTYQPNFIVCLKSNFAGKEGLFHSPAVLQQLNSYGVIDTCQFKQATFSYQLSLDDFMNQYGMICPDHHSPEQIVTHLEHQGVLSVGDVAVGRNIVFAKTRMTLEEARNKELKKHQEIIFASVLCFICRRRYKEIMLVLHALRHAIQDKNMDIIEDCMKSVHKIPYQGQHLQLVKEAEGLRTRYKAESDFKTSITEALEQRDGTTLDTLLKVADERWGTLIPDGLEDIVTEALGMREELLSEEQIISTLEKALEDQNAHHIADALKTVQSKEIEATELVDKALRMLDAVASLQDAVELMDEYALRAAIEKAQDIFIDQKMAERMIAELSVRTLRAMRKLDSGMLSDILSHCMNSPHADDPHIKEIIERGKLVEKAITMLETGIQHSNLRDVEEGYRIIKNIQGIDPATPLLLSAHDSMKDLREKQGIREKLCAAMLHHNVSDIRQCLDAATATGLNETSCPEMIQARKLVKNWEAVEHCRSTLNELAVSEEATLELLEKALDWSKSLGLDRDDAAVRAARERLNFLDNERSSLIAIEEAISNCDSKGLENAIDKANEHQVEEEKLKNPLVILAILQACDRRNPETAVEDLDAALLEADLAGIPDSAAVIIRGQEILSQFLEEQDLYNDIQVLIENASYLGVMKPKSNKFSTDTSGEELEVIPEEEVDEDGNIVGKRRGGTSLDEEEDEEEEFEEEDFDDSGSLNSSSQYTEGFPFDTLLTKLKQCGQKLLQCIQKGEEMNLGDKDEHIIEAQRMVDTLSQRIQVFTDIHQSIFDWDIDRLRAAVKESKGLRLSTEEVILGKKMLISLKELDYQLTEGIDKDAILTSFEKVRVLAPANSNGENIENRVEDVLRMIEVQDMHRAELHEICEDFKHLIGSTEEVVQAVSVLEAQLEQFVGLGLRDRCIEWTEGETLLERFKDGLIIASQLKRHSDRRNLNDLESTYRRAAALGMNESNCEQISEAMDTLEQLRNEQKISVQLSKMLETRDLKEWELVLKDCVRWQISISVRQAEIARRTIQKITRKMELRSMVEEALDEEDLDFLALAIDAIESEGLLDVLSGDPNNLDSRSSFAQSPMAMGSSMRRRGTSTDVSSKQGNQANRRTSKMRTISSDLTMMRKLNARRGSRRRSARRGSYGVGAEVSLAFEGWFVMALEKLAEAPQIEENVISGVTMNIPYFGTVIVRRWHSIDGTRAGSSLIHATSGIMLRYRYTKTRPEEVDHGMTDDILVEEEEEEEESDTESEEEEEGDSEDEGKSDNSDEPEIQYKITKRWYGRGDVTAFIAGFLCAENVWVTRARWTAICSMLGVVDLAIFFDHPKGYSLINGRVDDVYLQQRRISHDQREERIKETDRTCKSLDANISILLENPHKSHHTHAVPKGYEDRVKEEEEEKKRLDIERNENGGILSKDQQAQKQGEEEEMREKKLTSSFNTPERRRSSVRSLKHVLAGSVISLANDQSMRGGGGKRGGMGGNSLGIATAGKSGILKIDPPNDRIHKLTFGERLYTESDYRKAQSLTSKRKGKKKEGLDEELSKMVVTPPPVSIPLTAPFYSKFNDTVSSMLKLSIPDFIDDCRANISRHYQRNKSVRGDEESDRRSGTGDGGSSSGGGGTEEKKSRSGSIGSGSSGSRRSSSGSRRSSSGKEVKVNLESTNLDPLQSIPFKNRSIEDDFLSIESMRQAIRSSLETATSTTSYNQQTRRGIKNEEIGGNEEVKSPQSLPHRDSLMQVAPGMLPISDPQIGEGNDGMDIELEYDEEEEKQKTNTFEHLVNTLPPGWRIKISKKKNQGQVYYVNNSTGKIQKKHPVLNI